MDIPPCLEAVGIPYHMQHHGCFALDDLREHIVELARHPFEFLCSYLGEGLNILQTHLLGACFGGCQDPVVLRGSVLDGALEEIYECSHPLQLNPVILWKASSPRLPSRPLHPPCSVPDRLQQLVDHMSHSADAAAARSCRRRRQAWRSPTVPTQVDTCEGEGTELAYHAELRARAPLFPVSAVKSNCCSCHVCASCMGIPKGHKHPHQGDHT